MTSVPHDFRLIIKTHTCFDHLEDITPKGEKQQALVHQSINFTKIEDLLKGDAGKKVNLLGTITTCHRPDFDITVKPNEDSLWTGRQ
jgi:hypothetical protein